MHGIPRAARQLLAVVLLALAAAWVSLHSPTIFFDNQILLGSSLGVFAPLQFGWRGLPLKTVLYANLLHADLQTALALGFKEAVVGVINAALGLVLYLALQLQQQTRSQGDLSLRGLIFATLLLVISLPAILIIMAMGQQITSQTVSQFRSSLEQQAQAIAFVLPPASGAIAGQGPFRQRLAGLAFEAVAADGRVLSSEPALFARLRRDFRPEPAHQFGPQAPVLLVRPEEQTVLVRHQQGYWWLPLPKTPAIGWQHITLAQPARDQRRGPGRLVLRSGSVQADQ